MRSLLLCAGLGTRLRPITNSVPKCLVEINDKPLLEYWLELLFQDGIERVLINTHYLSEKVQHYVTKSKWVDRVDLVYEDKLLGTGGTILKNREYFKEQSFLVAHADNLCVFDLNEFIQCHNNRPSGTSITMMTFFTDNPESCGICEINDKNVVVAFHEKKKNAPGRIANGAVYIFEHEVIECMQAMNQEVVDISTEVLPNYINRINTFQNDNYLRDIGTLKSLEQARLDFSSGSKT